MKHIQTDYKVKMYIPQECSANQKVVIVGWRNDEDHAVPSVMKLIEKAILTASRIWTAWRKSSEGKAREDKHCLTGPIPETVRAMTQDDGSFTMVSSLSSFSSQCKFLLKFFRGRTILTWTDSFGHHVQPLQTLLFGLTCEHL